MAGCRILFVESTLAAVRLGLRMKLKMQTHGKHGKKNRPTENTKTHRETHISPATATNSRRHAKKHGPRVSPYSLASIDAGFVEIGLVQFSQAVKTTNVTHTLTDTQTDRRTDEQTDRQKN